MHKSPFFVIFIFILFLLISLETRFATGQISLTFSEDLEVGDEFSWIVDRNMKNGETVTSGNFHEGAVIHIEITSELADYNHYSLNAADQLYGLFAFRIDEIDYSVIFVIDFILPVVLLYENDSKGNLFKDKVSREPVISDETSKITREIIGDEYVETIEIFRSDNTVNFRYESRLDYNLGVLNLLNSTSDDFQLTISRTQNNNEIENLVSFPLAEMLLGVPIFYKLRRKTEST